MVSKASVHKSLVVNSNATAVDPICRQILAEVKTGNFGDEDLFGIHLAMEEALINAIKHGNKGNPNEQIDIEYTITPDEFHISITDNGAGFKPGIVPDPRSRENIYKSSGRGMLLMRSFMDTVEYNDKGNRVCMVKNKSKTKSKTNEVV